MREGWIKIHRQLLDSWIWNQKPFDEGRAWIDMIMCANYSDGNVSVGKYQVFLKKGQLATSIRKLACRWGWSDDKVFRFLLLLEKEEMIAKESNSVCSVITIINYRKYQTGKPDSIPAVKPRVSNKNKFNTFPQREYTDADYASIEKKLLNDKKGT